MKTNFVTLENCSEATGIVVVIDVLRAFTVSAYALAAGASEVVLTGSVSDALALKQRFPQALLVGEVDGLPIPGFDFGNSPSAIAQLDLKGKRLIHRTSAGTQGVLRSKKADILYVSSFVNARATVRAILKLKAEQVTFVITGILGVRDGDEDTACADYMTILLQGQEPALDVYEKRVRSSFSGRLFSDPSKPEYPSTDLEMALKFNLFNFAQKVSRLDGLLVLHPQYDLD